MTAWAGASVPPGVPPACPGTATASQCPAVRGGHPRSTWPAGLAVLWACTFICSTRDRSRFCLLPQVSRQQGEPRSSGSLDGETAAGPQQPGAAAGKGRKVLLPSWLGARTSHTTAGEFPSPPHAPGHSGPCHVWGMSSGPRGQRGLGGVWSWDPGSWLGWGTTSEEISLLLRAQLPDLEDRVRGRSAGLLISVSQCAGLGGLVLQPLYR